MDKNITKKGLLALKDSKPVPITAHSHEIIVPCVYTETVKKMMKEKGIVLPLTPAKLAELRKIAKATPGTYKADPDEKAGGTSHAKGTTNVTVNVKNILSHRQGVRRRRGKGAGRSKIITSRASGLIPPPLHPAMVVNPNYNLIRPFVANTPMGYEPRPAPSIEHVKQELFKDNALEKRLLSYDKLHEKVNHLEQQNRRFYSEYLVGDDSFVNPSREEVVRERLAPKSEIEIEDVSEERPAVEQPSASDVIMPKIYLWELDRQPLIDRIKQEGSKHAQTVFLREFENQRLRQIARTVGASQGQRKDDMVQRIVFHLNREQDEQREEED